MAGSRRRGSSLEERLLAIRATSAVEPVPPGEPGEPDLPAEPELPVEADLPVERAAIPHRAEPAPIGSASEGDTFLPAVSVLLTGKADVAVAVEAAVRQLWPPAENPQEAATHEQAPAEPQQLSRLLTKSWLSRGKSRAEISNEEPVEAQPARAASPRDETREDEIAAIVEAVEPGAVAETEIAESPDENESWSHRRVRTERFGRIGTTLIERGLITNEQLDEALEMQRISGRRVGDILVELGAVSSFELARVLADHMGVPFTDLRTKPPDPILATLLPEEVARRYDALAIARWNDQLVIAMANPTDLFALDDLQMVTRQPLIAAMAVKEDLRAAIDRVYRGTVVGSKVDAATSDYVSDSGLDGATLQELEVDEGPIVGLVNALMGQAITDRASDLHIEPSSTHVAIRFRIDGVLHDSSEVPLELLRPLVSRVKILAGLDIAQNRIAQDGRFSLTIEGRSVDVRVVTMPTAAGESIILRLLDPVRDALAVSSLGLSDAETARLVPAFFASQGAVFIVGPTGSGKTSTIYAVLSEVNTRSKSIVSIEDPVEFRLDGIKQMQINPRVGLTFPTTLPSVLRSDPDVVFIGEVRDTETARIAADASITGHLVLSTLHATSAAAAPMRLIEMGVEPYLVASALTLVASQRLARKLCEHCAEPADLSSHDRLHEIGADDEILDGAMVRRAVGCPACRGTGYRGRLPIFEIMPITEGISRLILDRAPRAQIEGLAVWEGMETLHRAALRRVVRGDLSIEEMLRVIS